MRDHAIRSNLATSVCVTSSLVSDCEVQMRASRLRFRAQVSAINTGNCSRAKIRRTSHLSSSDALSPSRSPSEIRVTSGQRPRDVILVSAVLIGASEEDEPISKAGSVDRSTRLAFIQRSRSLRALAGKREAMKKTCLLQATSTSIVGIDDQPNIRCIDARS